MLGNLSPIAHYDPKLWGKVLDLNVTANYRLIRSFDRLLRASDAGRAIFVTSGVARAPTAYFGAYAASKAALEMVVKMYAAEVAKSNLRVNLLDPGVVRTKLRAQGFPGEDPMSLRPPESVADRFVELAAPACTRHGEVISAF
jgi:NAD(P)-dependent dehydrogenase (short-subunit alcohol dehydrogenase family)